MLSEPYDYVISEVHFHELSLGKQKNLIKYAKRQITHYTNVLAGKTGPIVVISPEPQTMLKWWEDVLLIYNIEYLKSKDKKKK